MQTAGGAGNKVWLLGWYVDSGNYVELLMKEETDRWILKHHSGGQAAAITIPGTVGFETKNTMGTFDEIDVH